MKTICENENLTENLIKLENMGYKYIVKARDNFLSNWDYARTKQHVQLIACKTIEEREKIYNDLKYDSTMCYANWFLIENRKAIYNTIRNKSYTIRNDWTRYLH